jgi:hypothetical protein
LPELLDPDRLQSGSTAELFFPVLKI